VDLAPNLPALDGDRGLLVRALANVVENAVKYAPNSDVVIVATTGGLLAPSIGDRPVSELRVVDHGSGVPPERVMAMFQPFQRLGDEGTGPGIGLGLAVAKGFIEAMDGELGAEPTPGGGLTMVIRMPLYAGPRD
jgi:two-component system sensor histidine kinase KdpD